MMDTPRSARPDRPPLLSVIIPTKDRRDLLREALASVRALEGPDLRIEIIVADNRSAEDMAPTAAEFGARLVSSDTPGPGATRNAGYAVATGDFVCFLDDDDIFLPGHLRPQVAFLQAHPEYAGCVGQVQLTDADLVPIGDPFPRAMPSDGNLYRHFFDDNPQVGAIVVRDWVRDEVGLFDERLLSSEDADWILRVANGHKVGFVAHPSILFRQRRMGTHDDLQWRRLGIDTAAMVRNYRRGRRHIGPFAAMRSLMRCRGGFYWYFSESALTHSRKGETRDAYRCLYRALRASPLHAAHDLLRASALREVLGRMVRRAPPDPSLEA